MGLEHKYILRKKHITRKKNICKYVYGFDWYKNDGYYNKGKIHCSCPICTTKTNDKKLIKSCGSINVTRSLCRPATTHNRYGRKNWIVSDRRKINNISNQLNEYMENVDEIE